MTQYNDNATTPKSNGVAYDDSEDRHLVIWCDDDDDEGHVVAGAISGGVVTYGTSVNFGSSVQEVYIDYSPALDTFLCLWVNDDGSGNASLYAFTVTLSGSTITKSGNTLISTGFNITDHIPTSLTFDVASGKFVAFYILVSTFYYIVIDISSGISLGTATAVGLSVSGSDTGSFTSVYSTADSKIFLLINDTSDYSLVGVIGTLSGTTISFGAETSLTSASTCYAVLDSCYDSNSEYCVLFYNAGAGTGSYYVQLLDISSGIPNLVGSSSEVPSNAVDKSDSMRVSSIFGSGNNTITVVASRDSMDPGVNANVYANIAAISSGTISFPLSSSIAIDDDLGDEIGFATALGGRPVIAYDSTLGVGVVCYAIYDSGASVYKGNTKTISVGSYGYATGATDSGGIISDGGEYDGQIVLPANGHVPFSQEFGMKGQCLDIENGHWIIAGHRINSVGDVYVTDTRNGIDLPVLRETGYTTSVNYSYSAGLGGEIALITFTAEPYPSLLDEVWCNVEGLYDATDGYITNPVSVIEHFIVNYLGFTSANYDATTFATAETEATSRGYETSAVIEMGSTMSAKEFIEGIATSFGLTLAYDKNGKLTIKFLD